MLYRRRSYRGASTKFKKEVVVGEVTETDFTVSDKSWMKFRSSEIKSLAI